MVAKILPRTGGRVLVDALHAYGIDTAFAVAGESYLPVLDAFYDRRDEMKLITCRNEGPACHMAEAYGKLTGRPGACFVSRGPGAMQAAIGVHTAQQDSTPLLLFIGQVARDHLERDALQEMEYRKVFSSFAKWTVQIDSAERIPELIARAVRIATTGRPGPVVIALPEDMLDDVVEVADVAPFTPVRPHPGAADMARLRSLLLSAQRPLIIVGGGDWSHEAARNVEELSSRFQLPAAVSFRRQHYFDNDHPNYVGDLGLGVSPKLAQRVRQADLILAIGVELGDVVTGSYSFMDVPTPSQILIHVHPDPQELGKVYQPTLAINAGITEFATAAAAIEAPAALPWSGWTGDLAAEQQEIRRSVPDPGDVSLGPIMEWLSDFLPRDAVLTNGGGTYTLWLLRHYRFRRFGSQLAPASGSMGYGLPAAIAAKVVYPERPAIAFAGDGCFLMVGQELATAVQYQLPIIVVVINNGSYGSIRLHQERRYPHRVSGTDLVNPDFVAYAQSFGIAAERVQKTEEFAAAFERAYRSGRPALIEVRVSPEAMGPGRTLSAERGKLLQQVQA